MKFIIHACLIATTFPVIAGAQQIARSQQPEKPQQAADTQQTAATTTATTPTPQTTSTTPVAPTSATPPQQAPALTLPFDFSATLFGNYQYRGEQAARGANKFDLERAYLTFKGKLSDRASFRVTTDVYQQTSAGADAYYKGWTLRAKYAFLQYDYLKSNSWNATARVGIVHTMLIDYEEGFWPRWISPVAVDRAGYFASADPGIATVVSLPGKTGEIYAAVSNGSGYSSRESDRFKDYQFRLALQPLANSHSFLKTFAIVPWFYKGALASKFVDGGTGQIGPVGSALQRDRWGVFAGLRDPRMTLGFDYAQRKDQGETGDNTVALPRAIADSTGSLTSVYTVIHPFQMLNKQSKAPIGIVARYDRVKPNTSSDPYYYTVITGLTFDLSKKASFSLDYQEQTPVNGPVVAPTRTYFLHWVANF